MTVVELTDHLRVHRPRLREYCSSDPTAAVREACGYPGARRDERELRIRLCSTVIQQALLEVLQPLFDPTFSEASYGFGPGRSAQRRAQAYVQDGLSLSWKWTWKSSSTVNHDILMGSLAKRIADRHVLRLIRR